MAAMVQYRMVDIQPDLVVMAFIPQDFNLSRTPIIDATGYFVDQRIGILLDSPVREVLRGVLLLYVLREIALPWFFSSQDVSSLVSRGEIPESYRYIQRFKETTEQHELVSMILFFPQMLEKAWGSLPDRLSKDAIKYLDLSSLSKELTQEEYMASRFDPHASPYVHRRIGEALAEYVHKGPMEEPERVRHKESMSVCSGASLRILGGTMPRFSIGMLGTGQTQTCSTRKDSSIQQRRYGPQFAYFRLEEVSGSALAKSSPK